MIHEKQNESTISIHPQPPINTFSFCNNNKMHDTTLVAVPLKQTQTKCLPMAIFGKEHFVKRELTIQVSFDHIHPALQARLRVQRLKQRQNTA